MNLLSGPKTEVQTRRITVYVEYDGKDYEKFTRKYEFDVDVLCNPNYRDFRNDVADEINSDVEFKQFGNTLQANRVTLYKCTTDWSRGERLNSRNFQADGVYEMFALIAQPVQKQDTKEGGGGEEEGKECQGKLACCGCVSVSVSCVCV
jgi:hypothetical protein